MENRGMKKSTVVIRFVSLVSLFILFAFASFYLFIFLRCFFVADDIPEFNSVVLMRVMLYGKSPESMSAHISLVDSTGKEFAIIDRSWSNQSLYVEFSSAEFGGKSLFFPIRLYSGHHLPSGRAVVSKGLDLTRYYMDGGECAFVSPFSAKKKRSAVTAFAVFADFQSKKFQSKYSRMRTMNLTELQDGVVYEITTSSDGSLGLSQM